MANIAELERRVTALEIESRAGRLDAVRILGLQADTLRQLDDLNRRVAANELIATANARTTEAGFANVQTQILALDAKIDGVDAKVDGVNAKVDSVNAKVDSVNAKVDSMRGEVDSVRADVAALRRDLPGMLVDAIRASRDT